ncbi:Dynein heavy chain 10, axonemal [Ameca splendens]|uniref:Dynein heavy chain 10, axonemal n=1 Tax=Ameca splendens TaxID=208324 RepID=A0ABV0ZIM1_9TELE
MTPKEHERGQHPNAKATSNVRQELECFNKLVVRMQWSLAEALAGEVGMSSELDEMARTLFNGYIPAI